MRVAGLVQDSIVDGPGIRFVVFTQGCSICCDGCHNQDTWDFGGGTEMSLDDIISEMLSNPLTDGLTITGGEPFQQAADCASLAAVAHDNGLNVWTFTGKAFEELLVEAEVDQDVKALLEQTDALVDGRFIIEERTLSKKWCGSTNQRVIDVRERLELDDV